jgi:integrase
VIRRCRAVTKLGPGGVQDWAGDVITILRGAHQAVEAAEREVSIVARENANGARAKSGGRTVPVGPDLIRLYADYLHEEYGSIDSDHVFVNIWAEPKGHAWSYQAAYDLVLRLRARTGIDFDPHWFRHSAAPYQFAGRRPGRGRLHAPGPFLGIRHVVGSSVSVTSSVYGHLTAEDAPTALEKAGWLTGKEVSC